MFTRKQADLEDAINTSVFKITKQIEKGIGTEWSDYDDLCLIYLIVAFAHNINFTVYCNERLQPNEGWFY